MRQTWLVFMVLGACGAKATTSPQRKAEPPVVAQASVDAGGVASTAAVAPELDAFLAKWPLAKQAAQDRGYLAALHEALCDRRPGKGTHAAFSVSPDGTQLLVAVPVDLEPPLAKTLGLEPKTAPNFIATVVIGFHGSAGKGWVASYAERDGCDQPQPTFSWTPDGVRAAIAWTYGKHSSLALIDVAAQKIAYTAGTQDYVLAPGLRRVAYRGISSGHSDRSHVKGDDLLFGEHHTIRLWGDSDWNTGYRITAIRWSSDTVLTFCGATPTQKPTLYRVVIEPGGAIPKSTITAVGPCS